MRLLKVPHFADRPRESRPVSSSSRWLHCRTFSSLPSNPIGIGRAHNHHAETWAHDLAHNHLPSSHASLATGQNTPRNGRSKYRYSELDAAEALLRQLYFNTRKFPVAPRNSFADCLIQIAPIFFKIVSEIVLFVGHHVIGPFTCAGL